MKFTEIVKLATNGYKTAEIDELKALAIDNPEVLTLALNGNSLSDVKELLTLTDSEEGPKPEEPAADPGEKDPEPDYKSLYEELKKKSEDQEATIKEIQLKNQTTPGPALPTEDQELQDIVKAFM